jgi:signal transduction histidine kinase
MRHRNIKFELDAHPDLPVVIGIPDQLRQVVLNLFMNAIDAMPDGGNLKVQTRYAAERDQILLVVKDTGTGINPNLLPHIFEPYITDKNTGTGLGLTITRDIIHQHHGEIRAENDGGGGAMFKVWLPIRKEE